MPRDANPSGDIFGGWTVSQMDLAGATFAAKHAQGGSPPCRSTPWSSCAPSR
jgi:acyl-CoA hydrolase